MDDLTDHLSHVHPLRAQATPAFPNTSISNVHRCDICWESFQSADALASHRQTKKHPFVCSTCNQAFVALELLERHRSDAHSQRGRELSVANGVKASPPLPWELPSTGGIRSGTQCDYCNQRLPSWTDLMRHIGSFHGYSCSKCARQSPSFMEWSQHFRAKHKTQSKASLAARGSPPAVPVTRQTSSQSNCGRQNRLLCDQCNKKFKSNEALRAHAAAKHPGGPNCSACQHKATSAASLEAHVNEVHRCAVCQDGIVRDAKTLGDHMVEHTHPFRCEICETMYRSAEERSVHFTSSDRHPLCAKCRTGFVDAVALQAHVSSNHRPARIPTRPCEELKCPRCPESSASYFTLEAHLVGGHSTFECHICRESYSAQSALTDHISTAHSCPVCGEGVFLDAKSLEEHQEEHRDPYRCMPCGTCYAEEGLHYKESSNGVHPVCAQCDLAFGSDDTYNIHMVEVHRPTPCETCKGLIVDETDLPHHYLSSRRHPTCGTCQMGFKDRFGFAEHGALQHPESHCYLCQWQFDSCDALQSHIRRFANHPKCVNCDLCFADHETYQHHLFAVHCPKDSYTAMPTRHEEHQLSLPSLADRVIDKQPGCSSEAYGSLCASSTPCPPTENGYSNPTLNYVDSEYSTRLDAQSCCATPVIDQPSPRESGLRQFVPPSLNVDSDKYADSHQELNHSPSSMVPTMGTPLLPSAQTTLSVDYRRPFSPRPDGPPAFRAIPVTESVTKGSVHSSHEDGSSSSFARSPPLISPGTQLPGPVAVPSTSSGRTSDGGSVTRLSLNSSVSSHPKIFSGTDKSASARQVPDTYNSTRCTPDSTNPTSLESARISIFAVTQTLEDPRGARTSLPLNHPTSRVSSPPVPHSQTNSSPIISSAGLALGDSGRRREVRFDDTMMSEPVWDHESTSSDDASLDIPVNYPRLNGIHTRKHGIFCFPVHYQA
ncbi:hypothetical protein EDD16DRAFT_814726 [Pisolithus croceorrhizus]|nr:hypothetical protein EDD16DRAFT_814726 [Pisolithus croceorrhizus]KAI6097690.1 hypothetical protein EV401DRAFT_1049444 [Pisolithus croceorrhizus]KAI6158602.1 hypothetical protein EDD17DRAFT_1005696 [Pisolithus thermaeus]